MQNAKLSGGRTHVRYDHYRYPVIIEVVCPYCAKRSSLVHTDAAVDIEHFLDIDYRGRTWFFSCNYCIKRELVLWDETKKFNLFFKTDIRNEIIWAWNQKHFEYLLSVLNKEENKDNTWACFKTYIKKGWFLKIKSKSQLAQLANLLDANQEKRSI